MVRFRCLLLASMSTGALAAVVGLLAPGAAATTSDPAGAVTRLCVVALLVALTWGWGAVQAGVVDAWHRASGDGVLVAADPTGGVRRWVLAVCGVAVTGVLAAPVARASTPVVPVEPTTEQATVVVTTAPVASGPATVVVRPGDCLWSLAQAEVQPGAGPATVTARWRAIYRANRGVIGSDPDLIRPGQRLRLPS